MQRGQKKNGRKKEWTQKGGGEIMRIVTKGDTISIITYESTRPRLWHLYGGNPSSSRAFYWLANSSKSERTVNEMKFHPVPKIRPPPRLSQLPRFKKSVCLEYSSERASERAAAGRKQ